MERVEQSPLRNAIEHDRVDLVRALLAEGADPNADEGYGFPLLHHAIDLEADAYDNDGVAADGRLVAVLLDAGADLTARDKRGRTALQYARHRRHERAVSLLLQREGSA